MIAKQSCRSCKFLDVMPDKSGKRVPRAVNAYSCLAAAQPVADMHFPDSITRAYGFRWPPSKTHMQPDQGVDCPAYEALK
jgi:hypothetical protein